jgi:Flp pilus assembly protein TadG
VNDAKIPRFFRQAPRRARRLLSKVTVATVTSLPSAALQPPSRSHPHPRDRTLAIATVALLLSGVFDVGRALYCRYRLSYAVTQSASLLAGRPFAAASNDANALSAAAADLVRRLSGLRDLPRSAVRINRVRSAQTAGDATDPSRMTLTVRYTLPILSPHVRALFRDGVVSLEAVAVRATRAPVPSAVAMCSAV